MAIICDIDGTLLNKGVQPITKVVDYINKQKDVYLVTARPEAERARTVAALRSAGIKYSQLLMKPKGQDDIPSKMLHVRHIPSVTLAIDNDPATRAAYQKLGIATMDPKSI